MLVKLMSRQWAKGCRKDESCLWEGMVVDGAVWAGLDGKFKGRGKEWYAILMPDRVWKCVTKYGWNGSRIVWVQCNIRLVKWFVYMHQ